MTQIPAGWYPDPDPSQSDPGAQRYWDGQQWTEHVQAPAPQIPQAPAYPAYPDAAAAQAPLYQTTGAYPETSEGRATTPDGQVLAGWWRRVGAYLLDTVITTPIAVLLALPWVRQIGSAYSDFFDAAVRSGSDGGSVPDPASLMADLQGPFLALSLVSLVVNFAYHVGFLKWKAATPGKLIVGLRVRLRETPGPLTWGTVLMRWLGQFGVGILGLIPAIGGIFGLYTVVDLLWPLWDSKKQAVHDKIAKTNVVRLR